MSHKINEEWLQAASENFDTCAEQGDYAGCKAVIEDVRVNGFTKEANTLDGLLKAMPLSKFAKTTPYAHEL